MEYYSIIKNKIISFAGKWMELELFMLNEVNQAQDKLICFHSYVEASAITHDNIYNYIYVISAEREREGGRA
jgi:hypothetical protein